MATRVVDDYVAKCKDTYFDVEDIPRPELWWKFDVVVDGHHMQMDIRSDEYKKIRAAWEEREQRLDSTWLKWILRRKLRFSLIAIGGLITGLCLIGLSTSERHLSKKEVE